MRNQIQQNETPIVKSDTLKERMRKWKIRNIEVKQRKSGKIHIKRNRIIIKLRTKKE